MTEGKVGRETQSNFLFEADRKASLRLQEYCEVGNSGKFKLTCSQMVRRAIPERPGEGLLCRLRIWDTNGAPLCIIALRVFTRRALARCINYSRQEPSIMVSASLESNS